MSHAISRRDLCDGYPWFRLLFFFRYENDFHSNNFGGVGCVVWRRGGGGGGGGGRRSVERDASLQIISTIYTTFLHYDINFSRDIYDNPSILLFLLYSLVMSNCVGREWRCSQLIYCEVGKIIWKTRSDGSAWRKQKSREIPIWTSVWKEGVVNRCIENKGKMGTDTGKDRRKARRVNAQTLGLFWSFRRIASCKSSLIQRSVTYLLM